MRVFRTLLLLVLVGCDTEVWEFDAGTRSSSGGRDAAEAEADASAECTAQQTRCGPVCANILTNALHCGACNQQCPNNQICQGGHCQ